MSTLLDRILHEDEHVLVFNKPAGLLSQATHDLSRAHVVAELERALTLRDGEPGYLAMHHRLDLPTSGVMVLARSRVANKPLMNMFKQRLAKKTYHALCVAPGAPLPAQHINHLRPQKRSRRGPSPMIAVHAGGDRAETSFELFAAHSGAAYIEARPHTGRRHQLRAHLSELGAPILGDELYGGPLTLGQRRIERVMLHARRLEFAHPVTGELMSVEAAHPQDFLDVLTHFGLGESR
jgi:RluA family pseudouridine synthase